VRADEEQPFAAEIFEGGRRYSGPRSWMSFAGEDLVHGDAAALPFAIDGGQGQKILPRPTKELNAKIGRVFRRFDWSARHYLAWIEMAACIILLRSGFVS
jgi:hypothetical protein